MIRSMTGYGRAGFELTGIHFEVEVRSVNHRYLDLRLRLPRTWSALEAEARERLRPRFDRGKVDASVQAPGGATLEPTLDLDFDAAGQYVAAARTLQQTHGIDGELDVATLLSLPGVARFREAELPQDAVRAALFAALDEAAAATDAMRCREGEALGREFGGRLARVLELADQLEVCSEEVQVGVKERLRKRLDQLREETGILDEARLHQEVVLAADRFDITEEVVRVRSHVEQFRGILAEAAPGSPVGRRLDFLLQELGREANTIGSKAGDASAAHRVVELKAEIERVREQVQNVE